MLFRKLERTWSHNDANYIPGFKKVFPELNKLSSEDMCDRWIKLGFDFYVDKQAPVRFWIRFTLPIAIVVMLIMFLLMPVAFFITGRWGYSLSKKNRLLNWFRELRLQ